MTFRMSKTIFVLIVIFIGSKTALGASLESLISKRDLPAGWALIRGPQTYNKKTLFGHINGQAELFLKYGFQKSVFSIYQSKKNRENQIEVDIYDMGNVLQAFGIFSRFRNEDRPGGFGLDSFLDDHSSFFYKGKYFVMAYATESNPDILRQFSTLILLKMLDSSLPPKEISYFPKHGLKPGSIQYFPEGLLGHQFLKRGFQGIYVEKVEVQAGAKAKAEVKVKVEDKDKAKTGDTEFHLFLAIFKDSQEAMNALKVYKDDLSKKGKVSSGSLIEFGTRALKGEDPYQGKVIVLQKGFYLLGVVGFEKEEEAENRLAEFIKNVKLTS
ncbi:MAG: hypothetical protein COZ69_08460 [Deltaproteobacteria bacterium CG_4_8_14_3_um_filter_45_9]|nr:MAG: hypothetical protein COS40_09030 [Deltaproteobacteria bacterium CG03_land_8_20_14_0_80_45_14]PIX23465.1 MAG: hypothetical protein COZ69_08460 [Deltaproteobacteria bacterium CG_4_8_14_3_um_filter_45_9]